MGTSALAGGASSWLVSVVQGDPSWRAFYQGAAVSGLVSLATIGLEYLAGPSEVTNVQGGASRSPASDVDWWSPLPDGYTAEQEGYTEAALEIIPASAEVGALGGTALIGGMEVYPEAAIIYGANASGWNEFFSGLFQGFTGENDGGVNFGFDQVHYYIGYVTGVYGSSP